MTLFCLPHSKTLTIFWQAFAFLSKMHRMIHCQWPYFKIKERNKLFRMCVSPTLEALTKELWSHETKHPISVHCLKQPKRHWRSLNFWKNGMRVLQVRGSVSTIAGMSIDFGINRKSSREAEQMHFIIVIHAFMLLYMKTCFELFMMHMFEWVMHKLQVTF